MSKWGELWMAELEERRLLVSGAQGGAALAQAWGWFLWVAVDRKSDTKLCFSFTLKKSKAISCCINSSCHRKALQAQEDRESLQEPAGMDWRRFPLELSGFVVVQQRKHKCAMDVHWEGGEELRECSMGRSLCASVLNSITDPPTAAQELWLRWELKDEFSFFHNSTTWIQVPSKNPMCTDPPKPVVSAEWSCSSKGLCLRILEIEMLTRNYKSFSTEMLKRKMWVCHSNHKLS